MKKTVIFGTTSLASTLRYEMETDAGMDTESFCLTSDYMEKSGFGASAMFDGRPVVPFERLNELYGHGNFQVMIMVGYSNMNSNRENLFRKCDQYGYEIGSYISPRAKIACRGTDGDSVPFGRGTIIFEGSRICRFAKLGDGNIVVGATIEHDNTVGNFNWFARNFITAGSVKVGNNNFFGVNACIRDQTAIGNYCLVGAGAVIDHSLEDCTLATAPKARISVTSKSTLSFLLNDKHLFE